MAEALSAILLRRLTCRIYSFLLCRDSHRESGVFSVVSLLSPVESSVPSGAQRAHTLLLRLGLMACKGIFYNSVRGTYAHCLQ